ncbi:MAG: SMC-Scp complex subunit ScpB [Candidatus Pacebacteria bacterium]|nr:SMC-Scp complex subunit ScpB [Candidatus Paceibacterota bacterium]
MDLNKKLEAILFWKGEPISKKKLVEILKVDEATLNESITSLKENLKDRGIVLLEKDNEITLGTHPELGAMIEELQKEELKKDLSKASLETLSIVLYKDGASRAEIDYIRGVNSSFTLRLLSIRGLVERILDPKDNRRYIYKPSFELLSYMGVTSREELPDFLEISESLKGAAQELVEAQKEIEQE